ncbi:peptidase C65 Otubain-domain-containing protein [Kalaharituber pfeilii]|nr:peptidase C65 Otubain-domain-containing protein [Kalaharituber pfeilii]
MNGHSAAGLTGEYLASNQYFPLSRPVYDQHYIAQTAQITTETPAYIVDTQSPDLQSLPTQFLPEVMDSLIGDLKSTKEIALEYANADPVYVKKTQALYPTYTHYRKIRGDGNCAWRAIAFGYFELLLRSGNYDLIKREWSRLISLQNVLKQVGFAEYVYEDFATETFHLFDMLSKLVALEPAEGNTQLVKTFNEGTDSIIAFFKFLTSAWIKKSPAEYEAYLVDSVPNYCAMTIERFAVELDHVGVKALIDCLIVPADLRVEISYLDRSAGTEVNVHHFSGENTYGPTLRLLYRPGHYDIIYKPEDINELIPANEKIQTSPVQVSFMPALPEQYFPPTPLNYYFTAVSQNVNAERRNDDRDRFRASLFQYPPFQPAPLPFQTSIFRNSAYNPSHYQSENFQPELYQPELANTSSSQGSGRRRL